MISKVTFQLVVWAFVLVACEAFAGPTSETVRCNFQQTFENAAADSDAIFLGRALQDQTEFLTTKGGSGIGYREVKFEVIRSWKLVDRKLIWVRVPAQINNECGFVSVGAEYLVYANRLNDLLYISPGSRTMKLSVAANDLGRLGPAGMNITDGEFILWDFYLTALAVISAIVVTTVVLIFIFIRRQESRERAEK